MKTILVTILTAFLGLVATAQVSVRYKTAEQKLNDEYTTGLFNSADGTILDVASDLSAKSSLNILEWLNGRVSGLQVYTTRSGVSIPVIRGSVPGIFIDEIQVSAGYLNTFPVHDIAIVKIIKMPFYGGFNSGGGAIAIYTIGGEEEEDEEDGK